VRERVRVLEPYLVYQNLQIPIQKRLIGSLRRPSVRGCWGSVMKNEKGNDWVAVVATIVVVMVVIWIVAVIL
jgi:hypothetical protein